MSYTEEESATITCRTCRGSKVCHHCSGDQEERKHCIRCYYSGRCHTCGGSGVEMISRRFPQRPRTA